MNQGALKSTVLQSDRKYAALDLGKLMDMVELTARLQAGGFCVLKGAATEMRLHMNVEDAFYIYNKVGLSAPLRHNYLTGIEYVRAILMALHASEIAYNIRIYPIMPTVVRKGFYGSQREPDRLELHCYFLGGSPQYTV